MREKYNLTWHKYSDHLRDIMKAMMTSNAFTDVTLVCEDKLQIKAHKNILSACSPVFDNMLQNDRNTHSIIYLRGIACSDMESLLQFMYYGEATCYEERMSEFLNVAKSLEIKELSNAGKGEEEDTGEAQQHTRFELPVPTPFQPFKPILNAGSWLESTLVQNNKIKITVWFFLLLLHWNIRLKGLI